MLRTHSTLSEADIRRLSRMSKRDLATIVEDEGRRLGHVWIIGGPGDWSKDELVSYLVREQNWRCECGCSNSVNEAFCYLCGAGPEEDE